MQKMIASLKFEIFYYFDGILTSHKRKTAERALKAARKLKRSERKNPSRIRDIEINIIVQIRNWIKVYTFKDENDDFNNFRSIFNLSSKSK
jgi:hypothetical protein